MKYVINIFFAICLGFLAQPLSSQDLFPGPDQDYSKLKVGVLLYGCGIQDGTEIQEAIVTLLALKKAKAQVICFAPNRRQKNVVNHLSGKKVQERRNLLVEAARLTQGKIKPLSKVKSTDLDALIIPGGLGFLSNITNFNKVYGKFKIMPRVKKLIIEMHNQKKPIGFICVTPIVAAKIFGDKKVIITLGKNGDIAKIAQSFGAIHKERNAKQIVVDEKLKIVSTPAYMIGPDLPDVQEGITRLAWKVLELAR